MAKELLDRSIEELQGMYINSTALLRGVPLVEIEVEELRKLNDLETYGILNKENLAYMINNNMGVFDRDQNQFTDEKGEFNADKKSPKTQFISNAKLALNEDFGMLHALLMINGYEVDSVGGKITQADEDNLAELADKYKSGAPTFENRQTLVKQFNAQTLAHEAALAAAAAKQAVADAVGGAKEAAEIAAAEAAEKAEQAQAVAEEAQLQIEQQAGLVEAKLAVLGYDKEDLTKSWTMHNQEWLQAQSENLFDQKMNISEIDALLESDPAAAITVLDYAIAQSEHRAQVVEMHAAGDYDGIRTVVGGSTDLETARNAKEYMSEAKGLSESTNQFYDGEQLSYHLIKRGLDHGSIPVIAEALPAQLMALPGSLRNEHISNHLLDPKNFENYSNHLKNEYSQNFAKEHAATFDADIAKFEAEEKAKLEAAAKPEPEKAPIVTRSWIPGEESGADHGAEENSGPTTANSIKASNDFAAATLATSQDAFVLNGELADKVNSLSSLDKNLYNTLFHGIENMHVSEGIPSGILELKELHGNILQAEADLAQYKMFPNTVNENLGIKGFVGAPNSIVTDRFTADVMNADNKFMQAFLEMSEEQQQGIIAHIEADGSGNDLAQKTPTAAKFQVAAVPPVTLKPGDDAASYMAKLPSGDPDAPETKVQAFVPVGV